MYISRFINLSCTIQIVWSLEDEGLRSPIGILIENLLNFTWNVLLAVCLQFSLLPWVLNACCLPCSFGALSLPNRIFLTHSSNFHAHVHCFVKEHFLIWCVLYCNYSFASKFLVCSLTWEMVWSDLVAVCVVSPTCNSMMSWPISPLVEGDILLSSDEPVHANFWMYFLM